MAALRLPRGTRIKPVAVGWRIEETSKAKVVKAAAAMGVSAAVLLEEMIDRLDLDELVSRRGGRRTTTRSCPSTRINALGRRLVDGPRSMFQNR